MWVLIREASAARNLAALLPLVEEFGPHRLAFCTDDREPEHIAEEGHVNSMVRDAVAAGVSPEDALVMASFNPAQWHGLRDFGALAPGYQADVLVLPDLERFVPELVLKAGEPVKEVPKVEVPEWVRHTVRIRPLSTNDFSVPWEGNGQARVIGIVPDQIVTESLTEEPLVEHARAFSDPERDLLKIAVVERHLGTGRVGLGFVRGFGLRSGALASTVAHDAHNVVVVGVKDDDMLRAVRRLADTGGGVVVVDRGIVKAELKLPIAGLLSDASLDEVIAASRACVEAARSLGCELSSPFQTMAFLALSVIPSLKITDRGLVDVDRFELVPLQA
jgi:adenine deaminase